MIEFNAMKKNGFNSIIANNKLLWIQNPRNTFLKRNQGVYAKMSYIPKYVLKRMFKRDECMQVVKKDGKEYVQIQMINVISPMAIPEGKIDLGNVNLPADIGKFLKIKVNDADVPVTPKVLTDQVEIYEAGNKHTWDSVMNKGSAGGKTIPVGGKLTLLIEKAAFPANVVEMMKPGGIAKVKVEVTLDNPMVIEVEAELKKVGVDFDPKST